MIHFGSKRPKLNPEADFRKRTDLVGLPILILIIKSVTTNFVDVIQF